MSLTKQLKELGEGETLSLLLSQQKAVYVTASRLNIKVTTERDGDNLLVTRTKSDAPTVQPKSKTILDQVRELPTDKRLDLFAHFELCCGMNRGACICPAEEIEIAPIASPSTGKLNLDQLKALIAPIESGESIASASIASPIVEDWRFTKDAPQYDDSGRVYRQQYLAPLGKRRRSVEVDADDLDSIIER
jgi:hypothetical protein